MLLVALNLITVKITALLTLRDARAGVKNVCLNYEFSACKLSDLYQALATVDYGCGSNR